MIRVCGVLRDDGACGLYRIKQPLTFLNDEKNFDVAIGGVAFSENGMKSDLFSLLKDCDIAIIPRPVSDEAFELVKSLKGLDPLKKVVIDFDDNIFSINPLSPHYRDFGVEEVTVDSEGERVKLWSDGKDLFDIDRNRKKLEVSKEILKFVDAITVTTEELANVYREFNENIYVLPNSVDLSTWNPVRIVKDGTARVTWHGGCSHYDDLLEIKPVLESVTKKNKNLKLEICGHEFKGIFKNISPKQYSYHGWVPTEVHPYKQALLNADVAVIPLKDDLFNRCKSAIKWIEYSSLQIPCVARNIPPYSEVIEHGKTGFLYNNNDECEMYLDKLVNDPVMRASMGKQAYFYVVENYDARANSEIWGNAIKEIVEGVCH
jgi:glycosyltransferase involved in cell wall biosynthesis